MLTKRPCCICRRWFVPDRRVGRRQRACSAPTCQITRRTRTQASWRRRNPDYFIAHPQRAAAEEPRRRPAVGAAAAALAAAVDVAQDAGVVGTDFLGHLGRVLLGAAQDQKPGQVIEKAGESGRLPP
jgi:hypothetical protein